MVTPSAEAHPAAPVVVPTLSRSRRVSSRVRGEFLTYLGAFVSAVLAAGWILRIWRADLKVPFFYQGNDSTAIAAHFKTVLETGWYEYQPALGAPVGQQYHDFPTADNLHQMAADVLSVFTSNFAVAMNSYFLLGFPLAALTASYFLRTVGVSRLLTIPLATLYAVAPYHLLRNEGHLWLASYYPLPLALVVVWWIIRGEAVWGIRRIETVRLNRLPVGWRSPVARTAGAVSGRGAATMVMLAALATASTYYAVFVLMLLAAAGLVQLMRTGDRRRFIGAVLAGFTVVVVVVANMLPDTLYTLANGANSQALSRDGAASEIYALKIASLLLPPPGHPIPLFSMFRINYDESYPVPSESPALGMVGAIGLLILLVMMIEMLANRIRHRVDSERVAVRRETLRQLATLTFVALLCSMVGGLSTIISFFSPDLRGWNRMSIVILMFCLATVGLVLDAWVSRRAERHPLQLRSRRLFPVILAAVVLVGGTADQSLVGAVPPYTESADLYGSDHDFVQALEAKVTLSPLATGTGAMIFQLPFVEFPESPTVNGVADADQLKLYLSSTTLRWSAGGIRGRPQSDWPTVVTSRGTPTLVRSLATIGFSGIVVDRKRAGDADETTESALAAFTGGAQLVSRNQRYAYFSLAGPIAALQQSTSAEQIAANASALTDPVMAYPGLAYNSVDRVLDGVSYKLWKSRKNNGAVPLVNDRGGPASVHLLIQLGSLTSAPDVEVTVSGSTFVVDLKRNVPVSSTDPDATAVDADPTFVAFDQVVTVPAGSSELTLSPGPKTLAAGGVDDVKYAFHHLLLLDEQLVS